MRRASALIASAGLLVAALTGCSTTGSAAECDAPVSAGAATDLVTVDGDFGKTPTVDFPTPVKTSTTQASEIVDGTGAGLVHGQQVTLDLSIYNGTTGAPIEKSAYDGTTRTKYVLADSPLKGLTDGLLCAQVGSRMVIVVAPDDAFGPQGGSEQFGVGKDDSLIFVADVVKADLPRANGASQPVTNGLPAVVLADDGTPGITIPSGAPPTELKIGVLKKGAGVEVQEGDTVTVHYTGVLWDQKTVFDSSWANGAPVPLVAATGSKTQAGVISGFAKALIGQTVGSQVVAVIPPDEGYGDQAQGSIPAGSTLVFVVDILGVG
ncbi:MAG: FKBP-type peptidyl-prolyl cis-trans isomerase [Ramlibacter sp.]|nr:FKBP-type peptidyl-prolyl cis-trans isomerase [Cryobacterium sp.]